VKKKPSTDAVPAKESSKINPALEPLARPTSDLKLDGHNARKHERRSIDTIKTSLATYGQQKPIVALTDGTIIAGNGTLEAARELGWERIAVVTFDNEDEARARAFALMDNRSAELSEWDTATLLDSIQKIDQDLIESIGFNFDEIAELGAVDPESLDVDGIENRKSIEQIEAGKSGEAVELNERGATLHVRMVQLFLNTETHPVFMSMLRSLSAHYGKENVTDVVFQAVEVAFKQSGGAA
jgi:ParB-like chromosome segregation protein Spo0J